MYRKKTNKRKDANIFKRTAQSTNSTNLKLTTPRGGIRQ